ncbi:MAG: C-type lectin domain-containing protein [Oscillospiraceae bacterium]
MKRNKIIMILLTFVLIGILPVNMKVNALSVSLSGDEQWIVGLNTNMEYITEDTYIEHSADDANNKYWTSLSTNGGSRVDGTKYNIGSLVGQNKLPVSSAWYGKNIYFRTKDERGKGTAIKIPEYSQLKEQYKKSIKVLNAYTTDTTDSFYARYIKSITDGNGFLIGLPQSINISVTKVRIDLFNKHSKDMLTDAEGNYIYDLVAVGGNTGDEPDISGAAAWTLKEYIKEGYGFLIGHDTIYGYGGVNENSNYVPNKNDTSTPMYELNTNHNGHWNMNWLMGTNSICYDTSPYNAVSMILNLGDWRDKTPLYGLTNQLRITSSSAGDKCPTNYPYTARSDGKPFSSQSIFSAGITHSNLQIAYGKVWIDFPENLSIGKLVTDRNSGLTGTNNFYLTTNGNIGMSQIGHLNDNLSAVKVDECRILANTIMYLSQREPCAVCQSKQGENKEVHSVTRISSAEELSKIGDDKHKLTYPVDGCYILTEDITLPNSFEPIKHFSGHFNADNHKIKTIGKVFEQSVLGGWNLGTNPLKGNSKISNAFGKTTAVARCTGYLNQLFGTESSCDYSGYIVKIYGNDGEEYSSVTNREGKYILSNLPCDDKEVVAKVFDRNDKEVTEYGEIHTTISSGFWSTNETTPLKLQNQSVQPVKNIEVYDDDNAILTARVLTDKLPDKITWYYRLREKHGWESVSNLTQFDVNISEPVLVKANQSFAESKIQINAVNFGLDNYNFKAVFQIDEKVYDTFLERDGVENSGKLTIKERPYKITQPTNINCWQGENISLTSTLDYYKTTETDLSVIWQFRLGNEFTWENVTDKSIVQNASVHNFAVENQNQDMPYTTTSVLSLNDVKADLSDFQFRAVFYHERKSREFKSDDATITIKPETTACIIHPQNITQNVSGNIAYGTFKYTATFEYTAKGSKLPPSWQYKENPCAEYKNISAYPYIKSVTSTSPVEIRENTYRITTTLTLTNPPTALDSENNHYYFKAVLDNTYSRSGDISFRSAVDIKPNNPAIKISDDKTKKIYSYPSLEIVSSEKIKSFTVTFDKQSLNNDVQINATQNLSGVKALPNQKGYTYDSDTGLSVPQVESFFRCLQFHIGKKDSKVTLSISNNRTGSFDVYSGKYYEYVPHKNISWTDSYRAANNRYNSALQTTGNLAIIKTDKQQSFIAKLIGSNKAWLGATNDRNYNGNNSGYRWIDKTGLFYIPPSSNFSGNANMYVYFDNGIWKTSTNIGSKNVNFTDESTLTSGYSEHGPSNDFGGFLNEPWNRRTLSSGAYGSVYLQNGHYYYLSYGMSRLNWTDSYVITANFMNSFGYADTIRRGYRNYHPSEYSFVGWSPSHYIHYPDWQGKQISRLVQYTGVTGWKPYSFNALSYNNNRGLHADYMVDSLLLNLQIVDLTDSYGDNSQIQPLYYYDSNLGIYSGTKSFKVSGGNNIDGYIVEFIVDDNAPTHTPQSAKITRLLKGITEMDKPINPIVQSEYRADTEVVFSTAVTALSDVYGNDGLVNFKITNQNGVLTHLQYQACSPTGASTRAYVKYHIPDIDGQVTVEITSNNPSLIFETEKIIGTVAKLSESTPPNPKMRDEKGSFIAVPSPIGKNETHHKWISYSYVNGEFFEQENTATLSSTLSIKKDVQVPDNMPINNIKSGYPINVQVQSRYVSNDMITAPQTIVSYYPEFKYKSYNRILHLDKTISDIAYYQLAKNPYSQTDAKVHFLPLWYPDSGYKVYVEMRDCWTPIGELKQSLTDNINIKGSIYDDWYVAKGS